MKTKSFTKTLARVTATSNGRLNIPADPGNSSRNAARRKRCLRAPEFDGWPLLRSGDCRWSMGIYVFLRLSLLTQGNRDVTFLGK